MADADSQAFMLLNKDTSMEAMCKMSKGYSQGWPVPYAYARLYLRNVWVFPDQVFSVQKRHYKDQVLLLLVREHPYIPEIWPDQNK
eukprot:scaffold288837_cov22-Tisochrysis_lutea.AAC.1